MNLLNFLIVNFCWSQSLTVKCDDFSLAFRNITKVFQETSKEMLIVNVKSDLRKIESDFLPSIQRDNLLVELITLNQETFGLNKSALLIFDSFESLKLFNNNVNLTSYFPKEITVYVLCNDITDDDISSLDDTLILQFQYFLVHEVAAIRLLTFVWYSEVQCKIQQLIEVNRFERHSKSWKSSNFNLKKFRNFHGCMLVVAGRPLKPAFDFMIDNQTGEVSFTGYNYNVIKALSRNLNYDFLINPFIFAHGIMLHQELSSDMEIWSNSLTLMGKSSVFFTQPYIFTTTNFIVSPEGDFNDYEKLLFPFDSYVWFHIILTFVAAFVTIGVVNFMSIARQNFVFGRNVSTPALNVFSIFFGVSVIKLPGRNFARFFILVFIFYCLIIRTAWQGKMFELMQKNISKPDVQTFNDMIDRNYTFYVVRSPESQISDPDLIAR